MYSSQCLLPLWVLFRLGLRYGPSDISPSRTALISNCVAKSSPSTPGGRRLDPIEFGTLNAVGLPPLPERVKS